MKTIQFLFSVLFMTKLLGEQLPPEQDNDYYVKMASYNLLALSGQYQQTQVASEKKSNSQILALIIFNYFVQKEKLLIKRSSAYEMAIKVSYARLQLKIDDDNPFIDPLGWKKREEEPLFQFPDSHSLNFEEYQKLKDKFHVFMELAK